MEEVNHVVETDERDQATALANAISNWLSKQHLPYDVVDGAVGIFLARMLDDSQRNLVRYSFESGATITISFDVLRIPKGDKGKLKYTPNTIIGVTFFTSHT